MPDADEDYQMTQQDVRMAEKVAATVVARLLDAIQDKDTASRIMDVWGGEVDRTIGRGLRRAAWYFFVALVVLGSVKLGLADKFFDLLKP